MKPNHSEPLTRPTSSVRYVVQWLSPMGSWEDMHILETKGDGLLSLSNYRARFSDRHRLIERAETEIAPNPKATDERD